MEPGTLLLIGLLATLIVLIILQVRHSRREREDREWRASAAAWKTATGYSVPSTVSAAPSMSAAPAVKVRMAYGAKTAATPRRQSVTPQITLYQLPMRAGKLVCPGCEGENDASYSFCLICGQRIR